MKNYAKTVQILHLIIKSKIAMRIFVIVQEKRKVSVEELEQKYEIPYISIKSHRPNLAKMGLVFEGKGNATTIAFDEEKAAQVQSLLEQLEAAMKT